MTVSNCKLKSKLLFLRREDSLVTGHTLKKVYLTSLISAFAVCHLYEMSLSYQKQHREPFQKRSHIDLLQHRPTRNLAL